MIFTQNYPVRITQNELFNMSKFVVTENFKHHTDEKFPNDYKNDITSIYKEEMNYLENSQVFAIKNENNEIIGTIRALKWNYISLLPIQKIFGINPLVCINDNSINEIWHIGRFAIKKGARDINLLKKLMVCAIRPICKHKDNIAFAECDAKLLRIITLMGIKTKIVGESIDYLGSETIPVSMSYYGLIDFYNKNKHLIE
ncbi:MULTISPECIES: hypothetical protein [Aquimarina]|uniref:hypothetical protein n=1 Tax=Aquimarina TaxID=290174 RepID=UPI0013585C92|nr:MULTISPECIES: hypothetical protein [Aquimarina]